MADPGSVPMSEPLAYFFTWTTYGTWLPGDGRGWVKQRQGYQLPDAKVEHEARRKLTEPSCTLNEQQRMLVEETIRRHCEIRGWRLWAVSCRTNHVHVVVAATVRPDDAINQFKAWCTRRLNEHDQAMGVPSRTNWWTEGARKRYLNDEASLENAVRYVLEGQ
jgi:REP element-mobilizing transposase RayT